MRGRTIIAVLIAFVLTIGLTAMWSADTTGREGDTDANLISDAGAPTGKSETGKKSGNKVARVFTAPFRAFGRLFGRGKDENKFQRMTEKDLAKFESAGLTRVDSGRPDEQPNVRPTGTAREHLAAGRALLNTGRVNDAIAELSLAASLDPNLSEANSLLGVAFDQKGMPERAKEAYERAVRSQPDDAQTLNNLGFSLYQRGNYRAAVDRLKRAAKLAPTDQRILNNLALAQCRLGKYEEAFKNFARAGGELTGRLNTATMLERAGRDEEAIKYYEAALRIEPKSSTTLRRLADLYQRAGRPEDARALRRSHNDLAGEISADVSGN